MITIVNKHQSSSGVYVGRPTVLGNPYTLEAYTSTDTIARYRIWLRQQWQRHGEVHAALLQLARLYTEREQLTLLCWCAPRRCHAEVIREAVLGIVQHGLVERQPACAPGPARRATSPARRPHEAHHRRFTDVHRLPEAVPGAGAGSPPHCAGPHGRGPGRGSARLPLGVEARRSGISSSARTGSASASPPVCAATTRWPRLATSSSRAGTANRQAPRT